MPYLVPITICAILHLIVLLMFIFMAEETLSKKDLDKNRKLKEKKDVLELKMIITNRVNSVKPYLKDLIHLSLHRQSYDKSKKTRVIGPFSKTVIYSFLSVFMVFSRSLKCPLIPSFLSCSIIKESMVDLNLMPLVRVGYQHSQLVYKSSVVLFN